MGFARRRRWRARWKRAAERQRPSEVRGGSWVVSPRAVCFGYPASLADTGYTAIPHVVSPSPGGPSREGKEKPRLTGPPLFRFRKMLRQELRQHFDARRPRAAGRGDEMHRAFGLVPAFQDHLDFARRNRVADDEARQVGDAKPCDERRQQRLAIVDTELARRPDARLLASRIGVVPDARRREIGVAEAFVLGEMHRM